MAHAPNSISAEHALDLDAADSLRDFRDRFHIPPGTVYLDGNSLGQLSLDAAVESWKVRGIAGWLVGEGALTIALSPLVLQPDIHVQVVQGQIQQRCALWTLTLVRVS